MGVTTSPADWCPDAATQFELIRAAAASVDRTSRPLLDAAAVKELWSPKARIALAKAAAACCADPEVLDEIVRRDKRPAVIDAVIANPRARIDTLWRAALAADAAVGRRAALRAAAVAAGDFDAAVLAAALAVEADSALAGPVTATFRTHLEGVGADPRAVRVLMALPPAVAQRLAQSVAEEVFAVEADAAVAEVRDLLWDAAPEIACRHTVAALLAAPTSKDRVAALIEELHRHAGHHHLGLDALRVFELHPTQRAGALLEAAFCHDLSAVGPPTIRRLIEVSGHPNAPTSLAEALPATPLTVARCLAARKATGQQWQVALALLPEDATPDLTAGAVVDQAMIATE